MNVKDFTYLLQQPDTVVLPAQTKQLEDVLQEYPYFQAARAVHLKGLKNLNSFKYNNALKATAAHTTDREVLFDFITSKAFLQNSIADTISGRNTDFYESEIISEEIVPNAEVKTIQNMNVEDEPLPRSTKDAEQILDPSLFKSKDPQIDKDIAEAKRKSETELELGKPLAFTKKEKYSFKEWLQLTSFKKIDRASDASVEKIKDVKTNIGQNPSKKKKFDLIDKFIENNPKIVPKEKTDIKVNIKESTKMDSNELMTETLAKVYLEQKKYKKAIQAFKILSLKYPEKSGFFADRIKAVEKLQKENQ
ncbi:hypothetical protein [Costertonia aggregata]|uniref:Tetratricopeptide repeat protein n=1 Tax=Costertonia aggregata TaxID=343403 RepID=A0A7H9AQV7_9FLAO|nr:hypothetical protein [Costertonia aggregata]QLG45820.1 hypothetical protein HYG79_10820 [Costertonia aggregata]